MASDEDKCLEEVFAIFQSSVVTSVKGARSNLAAGLRRFKASKEILINTLKQKLVGVKKKNAVLKKQNESLRMEIDVGKENEAEFCKTIASLEGKVKEGEQLRKRVEGRLHKIKEEMEMKRKSELKINKLLVGEDDDDSDDDSDDEGLQIAQLYENQMNIGTIPTISNQPAIPMSSETEKRKIEVEEGAKKKLKLSVHPSQPKVSETLNQANRNFDVVLAEISTGRFPDCLRFRRIVAACFNSSGDERKEVMQILSNDPHLDAILPCLISFISKRTNRTNEDGLSNPTKQNFLFLRMVRHLLRNPNLHLKEYAPLLSKYILKCITDPTLSFRQDRGYHWSSRDLAVTIMGKLCSKFSTHQNGIALEMKLAFSSILRDPNASLVSIYGAIAGLREFGDETVCDEILSNIREIGGRVESHENTAEETHLSQTMLRNKCLKKISALVGELLAPMIATARELPQLPDQLEEYEKVFGYFGDVLYERTRALRVSTLNQETAPVASGTSLAFTDANTN